MHGRAVVPKRSRAQGHRPACRRDYLDSLEARLHEYHRITREPRRDDPELAGPELLANDAGDDELADTSEDRYVARTSRNPYLRHKGRPRSARGADGRFARNRRAAAAARPARELWIEHHGQRIREVLERLLDEAERLGYSASGGEDTDGTDLGDYLEWIREDLDAPGQGVDDGTFGAVGLALGVLRGEPAVSERAPNHGVRRAIAAADRLRADYAALTPTRGTS